MRTDAGRISSHSRFTCFYKFKMVTFHNGSTNELPTTHVYITTHNENGKPVFGDRPEEVVLKRIPGAGVDVLYSTKTFLVDLTDNKDIKDHQNQPTPFLIKLPND